MINKLNKWDLNCSVFNSYDFDDCMSLNELLCRFFTKINECIEASNKALTLMEWLKEVGLKQEVVTLLTQWKDDGTLAELISEQILQEINQNIENNKNLITELQNKDVEHDTAINELKEMDSLIESDISSINKKLDNIAIVNAKDFGVKADGETDDTLALQNAINFLNDKINSSIDFTSVKGGIIILPVGIIKIGEIIIKSNITLQGQGIGKTIFKSCFICNDLSKFMFDVRGTDTDNRLVNFEMNDFSIMQNPSGQYALPSENQRFKCSVVNFSYTSSCRMNNVLISGYGGHAIYNKENYDFNMDNIQILACGSENYNSLVFINGSSDGCNAIHINGFRFEQCTNILIKATNLKFQREIQFGIGKFEQVGFDIIGSSNINFMGSHFTWNGSSKCINMSTLDTTEKYGIKFIGCSMLSSIGTSSFIINEGNGACEIVGCNFKNFTTAISGENYTISSNEFYDCTGPVIDVSRGNIILGNKFIGCKGVDYLLNINGDSNIIAFNKKEFGTITKGCNMNNSSLNNISWNIGISFESSTTPLWYAQNNYQSGNGITATHSGVRQPGGLKYDINEKKLYYYDGTTFKEIATV